MTIWSGDTTGVLACKVLRYYESSMV